MKKTILLTIVMTAILAIALSIGAFAAEEITTEAVDTTIGAIEQTEQAPKLLSLIFSGGALAIIGAALAVGLAGIMGGLNSGIDENTKNILRRENSNGKQCSY